MCDDGAPPRPGWAESRHHMAALGLTRLVFTASNGLAVFHPPPVWGVGIIVRLGSLRRIEMDLRESAFWARLKANRWAYTFTILATLAVGILIGTVISYGVKGKEGQKSSDAAPLTIPAPQQLSNTFSQISKQLEPSVVNINTESTIKNPHHRRSVHVNPNQDQDNGEDGTPFQDFFDKFFGGQGGQGGPDAGTIRQRSLGSGVIVDSKGYIVTNRHV